MGTPINYYGRLFDSPNITPAIAKAANVAKTYGLGLVRARTPVDTGKLKGSWKARLEGNGIRWSNEASYAGFVEFGTSKAAPRRMLQDSLPDIQDVFIDELYKEVGEALAADLITDYQKAGYGNAIKANNPKYPEVGKDRQPAIKSGLSRRSKTTNKEYLFSNPRKIVSRRQQKRIDNARPRPYIRLES